MGEINNALFLKFIRINIIPTQGVRVSGWKQHDIIEFASSKIILI